MASGRYLRAVAFITLSSSLFACGIWSSKTDVAGKPRPIARSLYDFSNIASSQEMAGRATRTWGSAWADYNFDGYPDLFTGRHWRIPRLYVNHAGAFRRITDQPDMLHKGDRHACAWGEVNGDGRPDLYCVHGADKGLGAGPNQLFVQTGTGFLNHAHLLHVINVYGRGRTVNWIDYDGDGDLDLFVGNNARVGYPNTMFRNDDGHFTEVEVGLSQDLATQGSSWADWDRDGDPDLVVTQYFPGPAVTYENVGGRFVQTWIPHVTGHRWQSATWGDYNGDGWPDLSLVSPRLSMVLRNDRGTFKVVSRQRLRSGRMSVWFDAEDDGDLDLFILQGAQDSHYYPVAGSVNAPEILLVDEKGSFVAHRGRSFRGPKAGDGDGVSAADFNRDGLVDVYISNGYFHSTGAGELLENRSRPGHWVGLQLRGTRWNPLAFGTRLHVWGPGIDYWRELNDGFAFRTQSEVAYQDLGIGSAPRAHIRVYWPDGTRDCVRARSGVTVNLSIGTSPC